jgi:MoxR-like ATPase
LQNALGAVKLGELRPTYVELVHRLRHAGIPLSDRRAVKLQRLIAASALLSGRFAANATDMWVLRYIWDTEEQQEVLAEIVQDFVDKSAAAAQAAAHPRSRGEDRPDPERLARDLARIGDRLGQTDLPATERAFLQDQIGLLASRCQWVKGQQQREHLEKTIEGLWARVGVAS